jgi:hypothetical protein
MAESDANAQAVTAEHVRLQETRDSLIDWKQWGPYLSERQWGTVREDYSDDGMAWDYFTHDQARSRAYHWGEDGIAGISDDKQRLCFAVALWNGKDPILKERMFGLTNDEGNHGEDVKEYYFYLDSTPTHSYMKHLYKYPQAAYPYSDLVDTNRRRGRKEMEYELLDTGVFDDDRYFDVFVEYAKHSPTDMLIQISVCNRGPEAAALHLLPTLWFRNIWSWWPESPKPSLGAGAPADGASTVVAFDAELGTYYLHCEGLPPLLFTENETNNQRLFGSANATAYVKDAINDFIIKDKRDAINPQQTGTKAAAYYQLTVEAGQTAVIRLRLTNAASGSGNPFDGFADILRARQGEADSFYRAMTPAGGTADAAMVMRQALAGMLWSKQYYFFDLEKWLAEHGDDPTKPSKRRVRNRHWEHMINDHVISMPDKWEYPWFAAWDLALHTMALSIVDIDFAKQQLELLLQGNYLHPTGQIPAYEWNFGDVNPPVHAWATIFLYRTEQAMGRTDPAFLARAFTKLLLNFTWWVNRKDRFGRNLYEGGFLGLDNIGVFDRSAPLPTGGHLEQADGTAWMALYCQNMLEIGVELAARDPAYEDLATKFGEQFLWIARAMNVSGPGGMWDEEDGFYYDVLRLPDGSATRLKVRSVVGLLPICAITVVEPHQRELVPNVMATIAKWRRRMPDILDSIHPTGPGHLGVGNRGIMAIVNQDRLRRILTRMLDEKEFFSPHGIRALSRYHADHPFVFSTPESEYVVKYLPAESDSAMFGGNSNWRGPVWMPINALLIRALLQYYLYYGDNFKIECPTGSGVLMNLFEVAHEIADRLISIFLRDESGRRPVFGGTEKFQTDPHWRDCLLFHEYFHGDNGAGIGASHQTGWTGGVARLIDLFGQLDARNYLEDGIESAFLHCVQAPPIDTTKPCGK